MTYLFCFLILSYFAIKYYYHPDSSQRKIAYNVAFIILFFLAGFRYEIGVDYFVYRRKFIDLIGIGDLLNTTTLSIISENANEPLYMLLSLIFRSVTSEIQYMLIFISFFSTKLLLKSISYFSEKKYFFFSVLTYFCFIYLLQEMQATRQAIAAQILFSALIALTQNKQRKMLILITIASLFHYSSLIFFLIIPFINKRIAIFSQLTALLCGLFIFILQIPWLEKTVNAISSFLPGFTPIARLANYFIKDTISKERGFFITFILYLGVYILILIYNKRNKYYNTNKILIPCQNFFFLYLMSTMLLWELSIVSIRFGWFFLFGLVICMPKIIEYFSCNTRPAIIMFILAFNFLLVSKFIFPDHTTKPFSPYQDYITCKYFGAQNTGRERAEEYLAKFGVYNKL